MLPLKNHGLLLAVGSEVVNIVQNEAFDFLDAPIKKINSADVPMPYSSVLGK